MRHSPVGYLRIGLLLVLIFGRTGLAQGATPSAEDYLVDVWDTDSGLPHSTVTGIAQTPDGYLWVGTLHGGLARFDGVRFVSFYPGNTPELQSMEVQRLLVDPQGTLWIGFVGGQQFSYRQGRFYYERGDARTPGSWLLDLVASHPEKTLFSSYAGWLFRSDHKWGTNRWQTLVTADGNELSSFCEDAAGVLWYRTRDNHLAQYKEGAFQPVREPLGLHGRQIHALAKGPDGRIWVGTDKELAVWEQGRFRTMTPTNGPAELAVQQLALGPDDGVWVRTDTTLAKCRDRQWVTQAKPWDGQFRPSPRPLSMFADADGGVWLVHYGSGLWQVDAAGQVVHLGEKEGLPTGLVECWFQDREGNVWAGLSGGGLVRLRKRTFHLVWPEKMPHDRAARSVCEGADGTMWFGTSGESFLEWRQGSFRSLAPPLGGVMGRDGVVCPDAQDRLWLGTVQNGVWLLEKGEFQRPFASKAVGTVARALCADSAGRVWIGNEFGLYCWETNSLRHFSAADGFAPGYVLAVAEGAPGELWLGMANAELRHYHAGQFSRWSLESGAHDIRFCGLWAETNGVVWIGTLGAGLLRFQAGQFTRFGAAAGLPNEYVSQILGDARGQLWLGTRGGISRVSKQALEAFAAGQLQSVPFITYGKFDGLPSAECSDGCQPGCWRDRQGRLWFTTAKGAVWTRAAEIPFNPLPPPVHLEEVWVDGQRMKKTTWEGPPAPSVDSPPTHQLEVGAGRHYFEFHFTALSFTAPDKVRFRWRLEGLESDWVAGHDKRTVSYSFIPPGHYRFRVQGCNNDGVWNEAGEVLELTVRPYFWQTWWFRLAGAGAAVGLLALGFSVRMARVRALERLRLRIARDLHDEVGANLGSISLLAQVMQKEPTSADASLIRTVALQTIDTLRDIVWFIEPRHDRVGDLVARMEETARTMLQGLPYTFERSGNLAAGALPLEFRRHALPIFKEALHNLLKHSQATQVDIRLGPADGHFELVIQDNGRGFDSVRQFPGNGLKNMRRRAAEVGGRLEVESQPGQGCRLRFVAPLPQMRDWT